MTTVPGHCLCGAIRYELSAPPLLVVHCHCESCRRTTSAPIATFLIVARSAFRATQGALRAYASSPGVRRSFCADCGSPIAYETDARPDHIDIYACSLSDPAAVAPQFHVHAAEQLPWFETDNSLPRYATTARNGPALRHGPREI